MAEYVAVPPNVKLQVHGTIVEEWLSLPKTPYLPAKRCYPLTNNMTVLYNIHDIFLASWKGSAQLHYDKFYFVLMIYYMLWFYYWFFSMCHFWKSYFSNDVL